MAPPVLIERGSPTVVPASALVPNSAPLRASRLSPLVRLAILFILNLSLQSALLTVTNNFLGNELGAISRMPDVRNENRVVDNLIAAPQARLGYKLIVVWLGWWLNYDFIDISALTAVTNVPFAYLLTTYYNITHLSAVMLVVNDIAAIAIPTFLLRARSAVNNPKVPVRNRYLLNSFQVHMSNTALAIGVYVSVLVSAIKTDTLLLFLINHFEIPTLENHHLETVPLLIAKLLLAGVATKNFILNPSLGATPAAGHVAATKLFDAATATLPQTVEKNLWSFSRRTRTLIQQTFIASIFVFANTVFRIMSLEGTDLTGAAGYSSMWVTAIAICGGWYAWVGEAEA